MKASTKKVKESAAKIHNSYFNSKKHWASIQNGEAAFMNRSDQFMKMAADLHHIAETPRAHEYADAIMSVILKDMCEVRRKWFK